MNPINDKDNKNIRPSELTHKTTRADNIKNFLVSGQFKKTTERKPKRNQMKHLIPKKKKRK